MKPIKEYICSQEKLNPKKFFPVILFLFGFAFSFALLLSASAESQTLKSISEKDTEIRNKISAGFYNSQSNDDIGSFDIKPEFLLDVMGDETGYLLGMTLEVELTTSKKTSWVITATPLMKQFISDGYLQYKGFVLTGGRKFYFSESRMRGYFSMNAGFIIIQGVRLAFFPAFGLEYKFSDVIKFETEIKSTLIFPVFTSGKMFPGINAGVGFLF